MTTAVILIGRDSDANLSVASRALSDKYGRVEVTTFDHPPNTVADLISDAQGMERAVLQPYALELDDTQRYWLENALDIARKTNPDCEVCLAPHLGFDSRLLEILEDRIQSAIDESSTGRNVPILTVEYGGGTTQFSLTELDAVPGKIPDIGVHVPDRSGEAIPVRSVLTAAQVEDGATATFRSGDDFSADVDLETVKDLGWMVIRMDGNPLPARFGGPIRLFIPGIDDRCANVKSIDRLIIE